MKKILLPLAVVAISGGYVWSQKPWLADEQVTAAIATDTALAAETPVPAVPAPAMPAVLPPAPTKTLVAELPAEPVAAPAPPPAPVPAPRPAMPGYVEMLPEAPAPETALAETSVSNPSNLADGKFTGSVADAYYGPVQVAATVSGGRLTNVEVLQYPDHRRTLRRINAGALPALVSEAISAQSADVDFVSGATLTSEAFAKSLASALRKAAA